MAFWASLEQGPPYTITGVGPHLALFNSIGFGLGVLRHVGRIPHRQSQRAV